MHLPGSELLEEVQSGFYDVLTERVALEVGGDLSYCDIEDHEVVLQA